MSDPTDDSLRREALGAFVHELRTPITSLKMVIEVARRTASSEGGAITLDPELVRMMQTSLDDLQGLADALQESSRLERGKVNPDYGPSSLSSVLDDVRQMLDGRIVLDIDGQTSIEGPWDHRRLVTALAGITEAANRGGSGSGQVALQLLPGESSVVLRVEAGTPGGPAVPVNADLGYAFFRGRALITAMGGNVDVDRAEGHVRITVDLPRSR